MSMSICCHRERSNQTNTNHGLRCRPYRCFLGYIVCVFSSLSLSHISHVCVRRLYCCYDEDAMYTHRLSIFFSFQSSLPSSSSNNAYIQHTLSIRIHFIFSLFLSFFSRLLFKRRNSVQNCLSFFAVDVHIRSSSSSLLTQFFTLWTKVTRKKI